MQHWSEGGETSLDNLLLLCSHHHRLVHEGGYGIRRDAAGQIYFQRADGRVIPRCGYDPEDARPGPVDLEDTSAEGWLAALVKRRKPSAEVREEAAAYLIPGAGLSKTADPCDNSRTPALSRRFGGGESHDRSGQAT